MACSPAVGFDLGQRICEAIGFGGRDVTNVQINVPMNDIVTATVTVLLSKDEFAAVTKVIEER